jgi:hypothetical protein
LLWTPLALTSENYHDISIPAGDFCNLDLRGNSPRSTADAGIARTIAAGKTSVGRIESACGSIALAGKKADDQAIG